MKLPIKKLLVFFFTRQGLSGPYQMSSKSESDMDLIILVLRKKILIINMYMFIYNVQYLQFQMKCCLSLKKSTSFLFFVSVFFID